MLDQYAFTLLTLTHSTTPATPPTPPTPLVMLQTVKTFGRLDILVSNAAVNPTYGPVLDADSSVWDKVRGGTHLGAGVQS